jgi:hypothetical protein
MVFFLSVLGVMTTLEFTVLETRNPIVKMEEIWTSHVYLGFHQSLEGFLNELKNDIIFGKKRDEVVDKLITLRKKY